MGMDCEGAASAAKRIAAGSEPDSALMDEFLGHAGACPECAARYAALLPFLRRESGGQFFSSPAAQDPSTVRAVMDRIATRKPVGARRLSPAIPALAACAAAALALFAVVSSSKAAGTVEIRFSLYAPAASKVFLAADFTSWGDDEYKMRRAAEPGVWEIKVRLKRGKSYLYNFVVDGEKWIPDPKASIIMDDGFGNKSSSISI